MFAATAGLICLLVSWSGGSVVISPERVMVREGQNVGLSCTSHQAWFFCLWRHPGGEKECSVQEAGERRRTHPLVVLSNRIREAETDQSDLELTNIGVSLYLLGGEERCNNCLCFR